MDQRVYRGFADSKLCCRLLRGRKLRACTRQKAHKNFESLSFAASREMNAQSPPRLIVCSRRWAVERKFWSEASKKERNLPFWGSTCVSLRCSSKWRKKFCVRSFESSGLYPRRRTCE